MHRRDDWILRMSVCLTSESVQQKKTLDSSKKLKKLHIFLIHLVANHIMVTALPPDCPTLPDGHVLTAALVGMEDNRYGSMFLNGIKVCCAFGSSCNIHPNAAPVEESFHCNMNCALLWR